MSAREQIADRLWWSVPSSDDADAKAKASAMLDAFRAEVLNEVGDRLANRATLYGDSRTVNEVINDLRRMAAAGQAPAPRCTCGNAAYEQMYDRRVPCKPNCEAKRAAGRVPASQPSALPVWALKCSCGGQGIVHFHADHHEPTGRVDVDPFAGRACPSCGTYVTGPCPECAPAPQAETAPDTPAVGDRYDCRHGGEGVTVTRLWALDNGHRAVDFEYRDGESSALPLDSFRRAYRPEAAPDGDEWVRCSGLHCPNAERFAKATERGWQPGGMGTWQCPTCATGAES